MNWLLIILIVALITGTASAKVCTTTLLYCGDGTNNCNTVTCTNDTITNYPVLLPGYEINVTDNGTFVTAIPNTGADLYLNESHVSSEIRLPPELTEQIIQEAVRRATIEVFQAFTNALIVLSLLLFAGIGLRELYLKYKRRVEASK